MDARFQNNQQMANFANHHPQNMMMHHAQPGHLANFDPRLVAHLQPQPHRPQHNQQQNQNQNILSNAAHLQPHQSRQNQIQNQNQNQIQIHPNAPLNANNAAPPGQPIPPHQLVHHYNALFHAHHHLKVEYSNFNRRFKEQDAIIDRLEKEKEAMEASSRTHAAERMSATNAIAALKTQRADDKKSYDHLRTEFEHKIDAEKELEEKIQGLQKALRISTEALQAAKQKFEQMDGLNGTIMENELSNVRKDLQDARDEIQSLQKERTILQEQVKTAEQNHTLQKLLLQRDLKAKNHNKKLFKKRSTRCMKVNARKCQQCKLKPLMVSMLKQRKSLKHQIDRLGTEKDGMEREQKITKAMLQQKVARIAELERAAKDAESQQDGLKLDIVQLEEKNGTLNSTVDVLEQNFADIQSALKAKETEICQLKHDAKGAERLLGDATVREEDVRQEVLKLRRERDSLIHSLNDAERRYQEQRGQSSSKIVFLEKKIQSWSDHLLALYRRDASEPLEKEIHEDNTLISGHCYDIGELQGQVREQERQLNAAAEESKNLNATIDSLKAEKEALNQQQEEIIHVELTPAGKRRREIMNEPKIKKLQDKIAELEEDLAEVKLERENLEANLKIVELEKKDLEKKVKEGHVFDFTEKQKELIEKLRKAEELTKQLEKSMADCEKERKLFKEYMDRQSERDEKQEKEREEKSKKDNEELHNTITRLENIRKNLRLEIERIGREFREFKLAHAACNHTLAAQAKMDGNGAKKRKL